MTTSPARWCQAFYVLSAAGVLVTAAAPREARALLADYGARKAAGVVIAGEGGHRGSGGKNGNGNGKEMEKEREKERGKDWLVKLVARATSWGQVPHSWFSAFYGLSVACSVFWLVQYLADGNVIRWIAFRQAGAADEPSTTLVQVAVAWVMLFLQAVRRIYEHLAIVGPSKSTMWFVHWLLGLGFYLVLSLAVWVEGSSTSQLSPSQRSLARPLTQTHRGNSSRACGLAGWHGASHQDLHRNGPLFVCLGNPVPVPCLPRGAQEIFSAGRWPLSPPSLSPLHLRMPHLFLHGNRRCSRGQMVQQDDTVRPILRSYQPGFDGSRNSRMVCAEVRGEFGFPQVEHDTLYILIKGA